MTNQNNYSLSVVIPVFNEENIIEMSMDLLDAKLKSICKDYEIIVVDDASMDRTPQITAQLSSRLKNLKIVRNHNNQGIGYCLQKGFNFASKEFVLYIDSDMPFDYGEISRAISMIDHNNADLIAGSRINRTAESILRYICSIIYNWLMRGLFSLKINDINCAFKLIKRDVLEKLGLNLRGSCVSVEMLAKASYIGCRINQIELYYYPRKETKSRLFKLHIIIRDLFEIARHYREIKSFKTSPCRKELD